MAWEGECVGEEEGARRDYAKRFWRRLDGLTFGRLSTQFGHERCYNLL